jgi:excisionase family DNA binding protein
MQFEMISNDSATTGKESISAQLLTAPRVAAYLGLSRYAVRQMITNGQIPTRAVGKRRLVPRALLDVWLENGSAGGLGVTK